MSNEQVRAVSVWPGSLRLLHLLMASSVIILILTGVLMHSGMILNEQLYQHLLTVWHLPAGHVLAGVLLVRVLLLLFKKDVTGWQALLPASLNEVVQVAVFYLSLGRMNLPGYYAHNPLWKPVYLVWFLLLGVQVFNGLLLEFAWLRSVLHTDSASALSAHQSLLTVLLVLTVLHLITALLHDWKSPNAGISAMINGVRYFTVEHSNTANSGGLEKIQTSAVSLNDLLNTKPEKK